MQRKFLLWGLLLLMLMLSGIGIAGAQDETGNPTTITLADGGITVDGTGAAAAGSTVTITAAGTYSLSGALADGQVIVDTLDSGTVRLLLDGVQIGSSTGAAIDVQNAETAVITLSEGTQNSVASSIAYSALDEAVNAAISSSSDLMIEGSGSLSVVADAVDGISVDASLTINGTPTLSVSAGDDAIQVDSIFTLVDGTLNLVAGGGINGTISEELSAKGIKADEQIVIENGSVTIDAADDAIRSEKDLVINAGTLEISAVGKAVHASYNLEINGGTIVVHTSDEGIEGGYITINDGSINLTATDDGINVSEPDDIPAPLVYYLHINGGYIVVNADGDGLDSNGSIEITGGTVIVNGPTASDNGALDYDGVFNISGGVLIAVGSAGMPSAPSQTSTQASLLINFDAALEAGTLVRIQTSDGEELLTFAPVKSYQSLVFSSPQLVEGVSYEVYTGGSSDAAAADGLYASGSYTPGTQQASFSVSGSVTQVGEVRGMGMRGGRPPGN